MWVRSQDKTRLLKVEDVRILDCSDGCSDIWANNNCNLGKYSTKEKALKVLDMIQETINGKKKSYYSTSGYGKALIKNEYYENTSNIVFEMPADEEVK